MRPGDECDAVIDRFVPGGHALAHVDGRTVFVRHGLPGEHVRLRITEVSRKAIRADVIDVHHASSARVTPPCALAGVCGGCDFQHIRLDDQRLIKADVLADALRRQAGIEAYVPVEAVPGDDTGLRWRTRVTWQVDAAGRRGFYRHRSHDVVPVTDCLITAEHAREVSDDDPFTQVHRGIASVLTATVVDLAAPQPTDHWWDLYGGTGLFARALAPLVAWVDVVDTSQAALDSLVGQRNITTHAAPVATWITGGTVDGVVVDPPRSGLERGVVAAIAACTPRTIVMVSCDPVTFARDLARFAEQGYVHDRIRAFDAFPMTRHLEVVASLVREGVKSVQD
jgi:tRNA/tmRNA/rRNA uracil-C5-methylase (TrmA/RlmC/RlmD family)